MALDSENDDKKKEIHVSLTLLAVQSEYFRALISSKMAEHDEKTLRIELPCMLHPVFVNMIRFLYTEELEFISCFMTFHLLKLAHRFGFPKVFTAGVDQLSNQTSFLPLASTVSLASTASGSAVRQTTAEEKQLLEETLKLYVSIYETIEDPRQTLEPLDRTLKVTVDGLAHQEETTREIYTKQGMSKGLEELSKYYQSNGKQLQAVICDILSAHYWYSMELVKRYRQGLGLSKDLNRAKEWLQRLADRDNTEAQFQLACVFEETNEPTKAIVYLKKAAQGYSGHGEAAYRLYLYYSEEKTKDPIQSREYLNIAARSGHQKAIDRREFGLCETDAIAGHARAQFNLGVMYEDGKGVEKDESQACGWYLKAAEQGYARAQAILGACYSLGTGVTKDENVAIGWYLKAADQGDATAEHNLGMRCREEGKETEAMEWFNKSAEHGDEDAQYQLAHDAESKGERQNAIRWYTLSANQECVHAQFSLARLLESGGSTEDEKRAVEWYLKAATQGHVAATFNLAQCYRIGTGVAKNKHTYFEWMEKAANLGDAEAQYITGAHFARKNDEAKSREWHQKAADQGYEASRLILASPFTTTQLTFSSTFSSSSSTFSLVLH